MMSTAPPFVLSRECATRLQAYIQTYRQYAFASVLPSVERNKTLRLLQAVTGKLLQVTDQKTEPLQLVLTREEMDALKGMVAELMLLYAEQKENNERLGILADLAALKNSLKPY